MHCLLESTCREEHKHQKLRTAQLQKTIRESETYFSYVDQASLVAEFPSLAAVNLALV
jgi:hypothetical protein